MEIFDAYVEDLITQEKAKEKAKGAKPGVGGTSTRDEDRKKTSPMELQVCVSIFRYFVN